MAIPEIGTISNFEAGMNCLQNTSFISTSSSLSWGTQKLAQLDNLWKWGLLILALAVALCSLMIRRLGVSVIGFSGFRSSASSERLLHHIGDDDWDFSDDDTCSSVSSEEEEDYESTVSSDDRQPVDDEDFCVAGSSYRQDDRWQKANLSPRRQWGGGGNFSLAASANGENVVKLWDSLALGLDLEDASGNVVSFWDLIKDREISSFFGGKSEIPSVSMISPATMISAGTNGAKNVAFSVFDTRVGVIPTMYAEWMPPPGKVVGIKSGGVEKVYVRHDVTGALTVGDMRNAKMPLEKLTESGGNTWWDADAVNFQNEFSDHSR